MHSENSDMDFVSTGASVKPTTDCRWTLSVKSKCNTSTRKCKGLSDPMQKYATHITNKQFFFLL